MRHIHRCIGIPLAAAVLVAAAGRTAPAQPSPSQPSPSQPSPSQPSPSQPAASQPASQGESAPDGEDGWRDTKPPAVLTSAAAVRALTPEQAAAGLPVRIRGAVTYLAQFPPIMFVDDDTGGVLVVGRRDRDLNPPIRNWSVVQVEGVTARGGDVAYVTAADAGPVRIEVLGPRRNVTPRLAAVAQLDDAAMHGDAVEIEGVVRSVRTERLAAAGGTATVITLGQGAARAQAVAFGRVPDDVKPQEWVGAVVRARGVFNAAAVPRVEAASKRVLLRSVRDVLVRVPAVPHDALAVSPVRAIAADPAGEAHPPQPTSPRVRVQGTVTLAIPDKGMFVQDASGGGVWVDAPSTREAAPGETDPRPAVRIGNVVDVVAFPGRRGGAAVLADAAWRVTGTAPLPDAPPVSPEQALAPGTAARLVRMEAMVLSVARPAEYSTLVLQSAGRVFLARIADRAADAPPAVRDGSWVRVTGVCVQAPLDDAWSGGAAAPSDPGGGADPARPSSFHLLVPTADAVKVISPPGWWTPLRVLVAGAVLAAAALAAFGWVAALRRRVAQQTQTIRDHLARRALYEERVRIARDLHDSLEQDLLGITLQLNATEKLLAQPDRARQSLQLAAAMVRRSQAETHRAVWDLREQRPGQDGLAGAIREAAAGLAAHPHATEGNGAGNGDGNGSALLADAAAAGGQPVPRVEVKEVGQRRPLPPAVENHLMRVALEAVTNAVKHAGAKRIDVEVAFAADAVEVKVRDDGRGFDTSRLPPPSSGHFGLFGMRERAEKLGGRLSIDSRPGAGTEIRLVVPLGGEGSATGAAAPQEAVAP